MANKGQITEEDLRSGLEGFGTFSTLTGARPKRDNPFRATAPAPIEPASPEQAPSVVKEPVHEEEIVKPSLVVELTKASEIKETVSEVPSIQPVPAEKKRAGDLPRRAPRAIKPAVTPKEEGQAESRVSGGERKLDIFTEQITLRLTPEMRDTVDRIARDFQRNKTSKEERITANTIMRIAIRALIENLEVDKYDVANNEEDLYRLICKKIIRGR